MDKMINSPIDKVVALERELEARDHISHEVIREHLEKIKAMGACLDRARLLLQSALLWIGCDEFMVGSRGDRDKPCGACGGCLTRIAVMVLLDMEECEGGSSG